MTFHIAPLSRRSVLMAGAVTSAAALTAACGAGAGRSSGSGGSSEELTILVEAGGKGELQPIADQYSKDKGGTVTFVELPYDGLYNRLSSEFSTGSVSFDVAALDEIWLTGFKDALTSLDDLVTDEVKADLFPSLLSAAQIDGSFVGMPAWANTEILFYRTDLFDDEANKTAFESEYGRPLQPPTTWQEYTDCAKFFTKDGLYGTDVKGAVETEYLAHVLQAGESSMVIGADGMCNLGDEASLEALTFYTSLLPYAPSGSAQVDWAGAQNLFQQGQTAMMRFWGHAYRAIPDDSPVAGKVGAAPMIGGSAGVAGVPGGWFLSVPAAGSKQEAAKDFVAYAYEHNALSVETTLGLAARKSVFEEYRSQEGYEHYAAILETLDAPATASRPAHAKWQEIVDSALIPMVQKSVESGADLALVLDEAKQKINGILA